MAQVFWGRNRRASSQWALEAAAADLVAGWRRWLLLMRTPRGMGRVAAKDVEDYIDQADRELPLSE